MICFNHRKHIIEMFLSNTCMDPLKQINAHPSGTVWGKLFFFLRARKTKNVLYLLVQSVVNVIPLQSSFSEKLQ